MGLCTMQVKMQASLLTHLTHCCDTEIRTEGQLANQDLDNWRLIKGLII